MKENLLEDPFLLDNSKRSCFETCPWKYNLTYNHHLESVIGSTSLRYGTCWHEMQDVYYANMIGLDYTQQNVQRAMTLAVNAAKDKWEEISAGRDWYTDYRTLDNLILAFAMYIQHFNQDHLFMKVTSTERVFNIPLTDLDGAPFVFAGKIDGEAKLSGINWNIEHKTTGQAIYLQEKRLNRSGQFIGYTFAGQEEGRHVEGTLVMFHHLSASKSKKTGEYGRPKIEFKRIAQMFTKEDIANWKLSLRYTATKIRQCFYNDFWPMQHDSCYQFGACRFIDICEGNMGPEHAHMLGFYRRRPWDEEITARREEVKSNG